MIINKASFRPTIEQDLPTVLEVQTVAFGREAEARLCDRLIREPVNTLSLCAEMDGRFVGHVLLSELEAPVRAMALAPLAVIPEYREMQIGSELVRHSIRSAEKAGYDAVFVLGDPNYYERFGFSAEHASGFSSPYSGPHFMALFLKDKHSTLTGTVNYPSAFSEL